MPAVPRKKRTRSRIGNRRAFQGLKAPRLVACPRCHARKLPHRVCPNCGVYNGRTVLSPDERTSSQLG